MGENANSCTYDESFLKEVLIKNKSSSSVPTERIPKVNKLMQEFKDDEDDVLINERSQQEIKINTLTNDPMDEPEVERLEKSDNNEPVSNSELINASKTSMIEDHNKATGKNINKVMQQNKGESLSLAEISGQKKGVIIRACMPQKMDRPNKPSRYRLKTLTLKSSSSLTNLTDSMNCLSRSPILQKKVILNPYYAGGQSY